VQGEGLSFG